MNDWYNFVGNQAVSDVYILGKMLGGLLIWNIVNTILFVTFMIKSKK